MQTGTPDARLPSVRFRYKLHIKYSNIFYPNRIAKICILLYFYTFFNFAKLANIFFIPNRSKSTVTS